MGHHQQERKDEPCFESTEHRPSQFVDQPQGHHGQYLFKQFGQKVNHQNDGQKGQGQRRHLERVDGPSDMFGELFRGQMRKLGSAPDAPHQPNKGRDREDQTLGEATEGSCDQKQEQDDVHGRHGEVIHIRAGCGGKLGGKTACRKGTFAFYMEPIASTFSVRKARPSDAAFVHQLVVELARYEEAEEEVTLTVHQLEADAQAGCFECTVAEDANGQVVGMALHHARYSTWKGKTWYLEDLVVTETWRGFGVGRALFESVAAHARSKFAQRLEWQVLDWNAPAIGFYKRLGADLDGKWLNGRLTAKALETMASNHEEP